MCGIAGIFGRSHIDFEQTLAAMADSLQHRGPDAAGIWMDTAAGLGFAHRRLAILDLSPHGAQPMVSASGRFVLCYNGEIYNHGALRNELDRGRTVPWRGHSDTEILLEAIEQWGIKIALERSNGMFAFAVWDRQKRQLTLARDRMGEKPLYIGWCDGALAFASELRALRCLPGWRHSVDRQGLASLLRFGYVPAPLSIQENVFKLPAASLVTFDLARVTPPLGLTEFIACCKRYWSLEEVAAKGVAAPFLGSENEAIESLQTLLEDSVRLRIDADVAVGAMLSGGFDSSLIAALMQRVSTKPVRTFTIGFKEGRFDEAPHAKRIAEHIGSSHTEFQLLPEHALEVIPQLPDIYDEPFADASQIPTILVSAIARQHVTVALSGDGGDELFFGYGRYHDARHIWGKVGSWPANVRSSIAGILGGIGQGINGFDHLGFRLKRLGRRINAANFDSYYANLLSLSLIPTSGQQWPQGLPVNPLISVAPTQLTDHAQRMMYVDQALYLPEDILTKVDRASMAASLELRVPLLDHRIVEFSWRLPERLRCDERGGKLLLRKLLYQHVPPELVDRPKHGFEIPLDGWLRGPLRDWMLDLLDPARIRAEGYLDHHSVTTLMNEHLSGHADHGYALWPVLMFQAWQRCYA